MFKHVQTDTYTRVFMTALLTRAEDEKQSKCLSVADWLNNVTVVQWHILNPRKEQECSLWDAMEGLEDLLQVKDRRSTAGER